MALGAINGSCWRGVGQLRDGSSPLAGVINAPRSIRHHTGTIPPQAKRRQLLESVCQQEERKKTFLLRKVSYRVDVN
jgi:hypothetical protein